ncbi:mercuric transporter MerT family protein [Paraburkholderia xenovorans]
MVNYRPRACRTAAALGASACCAGPLLLVALGLGAQSEKCTAGEACAAPSVRHRQRVIFWVVVPAALALISFPLYAPLFY